MATSIRKCGFEPESVVQCRLFIPYLRSMSASAISRVLEKPVPLSGGGPSASLASSSGESRPLDRCTFVHSQESHHKKVITRIEEERAQMSKIRVAGFAVSLDGFSA